VVTDGTGITVETFALVQVLVQAPLCIIANIESTRVSVVTDRRAGVLVQLIDQAIAIIIKSVADFRGREGSITV
jgi:hypothetical protein